MALSWSMGKGAWWLVMCVGIADVQCNAQASNVCAAIAVAVGGVDQTAQTTKSACEWWRHLGHCIVGLCTSARFSGLDVCCTPDLKPRRFHNRFNCCQNPRIGGCWCDIRLCCKQQGAYNPFLPQRTRHCTFRAGLKAIGRLSANPVTFFMSDKHRVSHR
jgi:hypothetical protein